MFNSKQYWEERYNKNGNSGNGSYNELADFKAEIINNFIDNKYIKSIIDYGVGDGNQLSLINTIDKNYIGIDVSPTVINKCKQMFADNKTKQFILDDEINEIKSELVLSCDVIYHLIEDHIYEKYMKNLFNISTKYIIIYSKDEDFRLAEHVKFRKFTEYIEHNFNDWILTDHIPNKYQQVNLGKNNNTTSPCDFYIYEKKIIIPRDSELIVRKENIVRLKYIKEQILSFKLKKNSKILDIGGNNFKRFCKENKYNYTMIDLETPQKYGNSGYFAGGLTYDGRNLPFKNNSFDVIIVSFVLHHTCSNTIYLLKQIRNISKQYIIICEDLCAIDYPIEWHNRCFTHQPNGIFRSDEEWKFLFNCVELYVVDILNIRFESDVNFSNPYDYVYRIQYTLSKDPKKYYQLTIPLENKLSIYVSITSIFKNQHILFQTLQSIISQTLQPAKIFIYLSEKPYILDTGFENKIITNIDLLNLIENNKNLIQLNWVKNTGSYRKLLPLLQEKWNENCLIITIDDDVLYNNNLIYNMVNSYEKHKCVIGNRGFTPKLNKLEEFNYMTRDKLTEKHIYNFVTGKGGILYHPNFFYETKELMFNEEIYMKICDKQDDIWFYFMRIKNNIECCIDSNDYLIKDLPNIGLYKNFNVKNNKNTDVFLTLLKEINDK
jgi:SAM-dependent methyltransferase